MPGFKRILFPVAFSSQCKMTAAHVAAYARLFGADVILLHCEAPPLEPNIWEPQTVQLQQMLARFLTTELDGISVTRLVRIGDPAHEIIRHATAEKVDLIMMPTHGHGPFRRFVLGSVTAKILHDAPCPVWTSAHLEAALPPAPQYLTNILCAIDLDERGVETLRFAGRFASFTGARLIVAHATSVVETLPDAYLDSNFRADLVEAARARLAEIQAVAGVSAISRVGPGAVARFVGESAKSHNVGLVVVGRGGHGLLGRLRTHDYGIIRECDCPVLSY